VPATIAQTERQQLCDLMVEKGPLAPTLCEGWTTSDLAAHLYVREAKPFASPGIAIPQLAAVTQRAMDQAKADLGYDGLIARIRSGPPLPLRLLDSQVNSLEYFVHLEDVRRAEPNVEPREDAALDAFLWSRLKLGAKLMARKFRAGGLVLEAPGIGTVVARNGQPKLTVSGGPQEVTLVLFGRQKAAVIDVSGPEELKTAFYSTSFGI
jgi:uncharacterized protein (TIGR03085 family)